MQRWQWLLSDLIDVMLHVLTAPDLPLLQTREEKFVKLMNSRCVVSLASFSRPERALLDPTMPNPWSAELLHKFHTKVEELYAIRENPVGDVAYRDGYQPEDEPTSPYTMRFLDELQIADHVAFLAHAQEGAKAVSAICVEEQSDGLLPRLASNETPLQRGLGCCSETSAVGFEMVGNSAVLLAEGHHHILEAHSKSRNCKGRSLSTDF